MSKYVKEIFLNPIYDFLPLVALVVADNIWSLNIGIAISFSLTLILFLSSFFLRAKILSWNIFVAVLLLLLFGVLGFFSTHIITRHTHFVFPEIAVLSYLSFFVIFQQLIKKYLKKKNIVSTYCYFEEFYRLIKFFFPIFLLYVVVYLLLAKMEFQFLYLQFVYVALLMAVVVYEFLRVYMIRNNFLSEEWYPIVNQEGNVIGKIEKKESLLNQQKFLHPVIRIHILNNDMIYLQKRVASDLIAPQKWDTAISNHIHFGETVDDCLASTAKIRYGIKEIKPVFLTKYELETKDEKQLAFVYYTNQFKNLKPLCPNIAEGKFWPIKQVRAELNSGIFTDNFVKEFEYLCKHSFFCH